MIQKILQLLHKIKSFATLSFNFYDVFEFLHHPWHSHELLAVFVLVFWSLLIKITAFLLVNSNKILPLVFNKKSSRFVLWLLYGTLALISLSNLLCAYIHGCGTEMFIVKSIVTVAILVWDWKETKEAIKKFDAMDKDEDSL